MDQIERLVGYAGRFGKKDDSAFTQRRTSSLKEPWARIPRFKPRGSLIESQRGRVDAVKGLLLAWIAR